MSKTEAAFSKDDVQNEEKVEETSAKTKGKNGSKKVTKNGTKTEESAAKVLIKTKSIRGAEGKNPKAEEPSSEEELDAKIPLLDQPKIIEGSRNRKTVIPLQNEKVSVSKHHQIAIPSGKGIPLGRIPIVYSRLKQRVGLNILKKLHQALFGKIGKAANYITTFQQFRGFPFEKDSEEYNKKIIAFNKFHVPDLNDLLFCFDLDMKTKKKEEAVKRVLDFLVSPKVSENSQKPPPAGHPKRKATKRNYYELDVEDDAVKKKKKSKVGAKPKDEKESEVKENGDVETESRDKKGADKEAVDDQSRKNGESEVDNNNELKKPAKKRKRNQVIEEIEEAPEEPKTKKKESKGKEAKKSTVKESAAEDKALTDEELKNFLKKVLASANLEETTMKTVYGLISTHYPNYDFSKKKDFIKDVVKSLIRS